MGNGMKIRAALLALAALLAACKENKDGAAKPAKEQQAPSPFKIPEQYEELIGDYRNNWTRITGFEFSGLHWGQYISLYVNKEPDRYVKNYLEYVRVYLNQDDADQTEDEGEKHFEAYAQGTVFLKENYVASNGKPGAPSTITVMMKKEPGYDPATHDWEFLQFSVDGNILFNGNSHDAPTQAMCIKCHGNMAERDFVFSTFCSIVPKEEKEKAKEEKK
jgi:hypothetical protein